MGDKPQSGGQVMQTSQSTNQSGPSPVIAPKLESLIGNAWDWMGGNMNAPSFFPNGTVAPQSAGTISANTGLFSRGAGGLGYGINDASKQQLADTIGGKYLDPASNPHYQGWLEASFRPQAEQFRDILAPSIDSKFSGSGRTAGGAHFDTTMRGVNDLNRSQADAAAKSALGMYQGERNNQFSAMGMLPSFQAMDYQDLLAQAQAGAGNDAFAQRKLDEANQKFGYDSTAQLDWFNRLSQTMQGMYPGGQTWGSSSGSSQQQSGGGGGGVGSFLGPALSVAGMALPFFSDARLKDVVGRVGETDEGLPLYLYTYKGDDTPQIGPIAQHVEQVMPDAVAEHPSGYKVVDYAALVPAGGLL